MTWDDLPAGWHARKLGDVLESIRNGVSKRQNVEGIGYPVTRIETIQDSKFDLNRVRWVELSQTEFEKFRYKVGDIAFNHINSIERLGKVALYEGNPPDLVHGVNLQRLRPNQGICFPKFLFWFLRSPEARRQLEPKIKPAIGQASVNQQDVKSLEIPLPPLEEQRCIVARIEELMERIDAARRLRAEAAEEAAAILASALEAVFGQVETRGWEVRRLGEVANPVNGFGFPKEYQGHQGLQYPFVKVSDMNLPGNEVYLSRAVNTVDDRLLRQIRAKTYPAGTVIFPKIGGAVATNKKRILATEATFDNNVMGVIPSPLLDTKWLYYYLMSIDLMTLARATTLPSIRQSAVADLEMPLPSPDEQRRIVEYLDTVQDKVEAIRRYQEETREEIEAMTRAVLERAFRGEL